MKIVNSYKCAQSDLYVACRYGWGLCGRHLARFTAVKPKYTTAYIEEHLLAIENAELLPDFDARYEDYDVNKRKYDLCLSLLMHKFDILLGYIDDAFPPSERDIMYRSAGTPFYAKAQKGHWVTVLSLLNAAVPFLDKHKDTLETTYKTPSVKNNMPPDFTTDFKALQTEIKTINDACEVSDGDGQENTSVKIDANNAIYASIMEMCSDAARIFKQEPAIAESFKFTHFLHQTRGVRPAGIFGVITDKFTGKALEGVSVYIKDTDRKTVSTKTGRYEVSPLAAGKYIVVFEIEGYLPIVSGELVVKTGKLSRFSVALESLLVEA